MRQKSMITLELPAVLEQLAHEAISEGAKARAMGLEPSSDAGEVRSRLGETTAAKRMTELKGNPSFHGVRDVRSSLSRAELGGMLNTRELLDIAAVLRCARLAKAYASWDKSEFREIDHLFTMLRANKPLEDRITISIAGEDEITDAASAELADIRRLIRAASSRVREALQKIINSPSHAKSLQEPIITMRSDRYVIPVKVEFKNAVPGLVHDISSSGATLFIEPMAAVRANNEMRELMSKEKIEIERILMELSSMAASDGEDIALNYDALTALDLIFAKARLSVKQNAVEPELTERRIDLRRTRHPLLPPESVVPIDIELGGEFDTMMVTGPNTGGKTVSLKTLGLMSLMAQCGLHIPAAEGSALPVFDTVLADIGDEQSIEQSLSTFSSHMTNIVRVLSECGDGTLLLFDELGAGTDPAEGAALAMAIIEYARSKGAMIAATTHYSELKLYASSAPGVMNASCEFDLETLRPTYRLLIGVPGSSNAFAISERLGLDSLIIEDARSRVGTENADFDATLAKLEQQRRQMENDREETAKVLERARESERRADKIRRDLSERMEKAGETMRRDAQRVLDEARASAEEIFAELDALTRKSREESNLQELNAAKAELRRRLNEAEARHTSRPSTPATERKSDRPVVAGDTVEIKSVGIKAQVISVSDDRVLSLQAGIMRVTAKENEVVLIEEEPIFIKPEKTGITLRDESVSPEIDLRGMTSDEALPIVERFIDSASRSKLNKVTVIHGKGTGALRAAVQGELKRNRLVKSFRLGTFGEGEAGVTIVELR